MKLLPFKPSVPASLGIELEYQIIDKESFVLASEAKHLIRNLNVESCKTICPEITQAMIELNSSIHKTPETLLQELLELQERLLESVDGHSVTFCGGGTHPFQGWVLQKIYPNRRYKKLAQKFRYLTKHATVFGQHVHIGCENSEIAMYLTHALARYVPQLIAISASSPFYQGVDTGFYSARSTIFGLFPTSGFIPRLLNWDQFSHYFYRMKKWGIIEGMKDIYWDIRPKPEFGTVEIRVCDTPLTLEKAVNIAAYIQALSVYLWEERPGGYSHEIYDLYNYNRFQASRYGIEGTFLDADTGKKISIREDILNTIAKIEKYSEPFNSIENIKEIYKDVVNKKSDAALLREKYKKHKSFPKVVSEQCKYWLSSREIR